MGMGMGMVRVRVRVRARRRARRYIKGDQHTLTPCHTPTPQVLEGDQHGALVADIMNEKNKIKKQGEEGANADEEKPADGIIIIKKDRRGSRSSTSQQGKRPAKPENDITQLRKSIQQLCQSTTPLGKCIEGVQADLENMEKEFRMWKES